MSDYIIVYQRELKRKYPVPIHLYLFLYYFKVIRLRIDGFHYFPSIGLNGFIRHNNNRHLSTD